MTLRRVLQGVRTVDRRHPLLWDVTLAFLVAGISVYATQGVTPVSIATLVLTHGAVAARRRHPFPALLAGTLGILLGAVLAFAAGTETPWAYLAMWVLLFNVGLRGRGRDVATSSGVVALTVAVAVLASAGADGVDAGEQARTAGAVLAMSAASLLLGLQIRARHEHLTAQRQEAARAAVVAERSRIAQEMHDTIGHNLSVITSLANGGAVAARTSPDDAAHAFEMIGAVSRSSVRDVARVLTVLRHDHSPDGASLSPQPGLADVADLVEAVRSAGLDVTVTHDDPTGDLSTARQLAAYRIVQEALTNVLRHAAPGASARVRIARESEDVLVTVEDDGGATAHVGPASATTNPGTPGHGVLGMRERAEAFGGTLEAGPVDSGWRVRARLRPDAGEER